MEIINIISNLISSVGFPIAICIYLLYQNAKQDEFNRKAQENIEKAIDNNTKTINKLQDAINKLTNYVKGE